MNPKYFCNIFQNYRPSFSCEYVDAYRKKQVHTEDSLADLCEWAGKEITSDQLIYRNM